MAPSFSLIFSMTTDTYFWSFSSGFWSQGVWS